MDKTETILLVVNPISGSVDKRLLVEKTKNRLPKAVKMELYNTSGNKDKKKLSQLIEKIRPDRILVLGGDGTVKLVAESLGEDRVSIGIIPAGSANGLARDLDLPEAPEKAIETALGNNLMELDALSINDQLGLHISDFGLNAELIKNYEESNFRGKFGYAINSVSALYNSDMPYTFTIETANGKSIIREAIMVAVANCRKFGTGAMVNPNGKIDDGKFEILIFKKFDVLEILRILQGEVKISPGFLETIPTTKAIIRASVPVAFQIDGEYCDALKKVSVEIIPKKLRIAVE